MLPVANPLKWTKSADDGELEGIAIPFGSADRKDLHGEWFTPRTDLCLEWFEVRPALYDHGMDDAVKASVVGRVVDHELTDVGILGKTQLDRHNRHREAIAALVDAKALSYSSGAMAHLVQTSKSGEIARWPWVELDAHPHPREPVRHRGLCSQVDGGYPALGGSKPRGAGVRFLRRSGPAGVSWPEQITLRDRRHLPQRGSQRQDRPRPVEREPRPAQRIPGSPRRPLTEVAGDPDLLRATDPEQAAQKAAAELAAQLLAIGARLDGSTPDANRGGSRSSAPD